MAAAPSSSANLSPAKPRRRWFQYSLRTLLLLMLVLSLLLGGFAWRRQRAGNQAEAVAAIREMQGTVKYDYQLEAMNQGTKEPSQSPWPSFLVNELGEDFFHEVHIVYIGDQAPSNDERIRFWDCVAGFSKLRCLTLFSEWLDHEGLARLRDFREMELLGIASSRVTDDDLKVIGSMTRLKTLEFYGSNCPIGDEGIAALDDLSDLQSFILRGSKITDNAAPHLAKHPKLTKLELNGSQLTDKSTPWLGRLAELRVLSINETEIGDVGFGNLKNLAKLEFLLADGSKITDEGLVHLAHLTGLQMLAVQRTRVTPAGIARFKAQLPTCTVYP